MNITTTFRQMDGTEAVRNHVQTKVGKLERFLRQQTTRAEVTLCVDGNLHVAEVHLHAGRMHVHGSERSEDMYASIDLVAAKLERKIRNLNRLRVSKKRHSQRAADFAVAQALESS